LDNLKSTIKPSFREDPVFSWGIGSIDKEGRLEHNFENLTTVSVIIPWLLYK